MAILPQAVRSLAPVALRDDVRLRAVAVGSGLIPPRTMHSDDDARVLLGAAEGARQVVEIGVYEGASALELQRALGPDSHLHLIDPFGRHPDALPRGWRASARPSLAHRALARGRRRLARAARSRLHRRRSLRGGMRTRLAVLAPTRARGRPCRLPRRARRSPRGTRPARADGRRRAPPAGSRFRPLGDRRGGRPHGGRPPRRLAANRPRKQGLLSPVDAVTPLDT